MKERFDDVDVLMRPTGGGCWCVWMGWNNYYERWVMRSL